MARPQQEKRVLTYRDPDYAKHDVAQYVAKNRDVDARKVTASFQIAKKRRDVKPEDMEVIEATVDQHDRPQRRGVSEARRHPEYGINRDHPKIDIYVDGNYVATTTWARTLREAVAQYVAKNRDVDARKVTASFQIAKKRRTQRRH